MRIPINLASQPLENLRPVRTVVVLTALLALVLGAVILNRELRSRNEFRSLIQEQSELERSMRDLSAQQEELEAALSTKEAQLVRDRSGFMNSLILRKSISWTQLFMDLETTLPYRARITAIHPMLNDSEDVDLELTVVAPSLDPLVELLQNLESSSEFGPPDVASQRYISDRASESGIELNLTTRYVQNRSRNMNAPADANDFGTEEQAPEDSAIDLLGEDVFETDLYETLEEEVPAEAMPEEGSMEGLHGQTGPREGAL